MYAVALLPKFRAATGITVNPMVGVPRDRTESRTVTVTLDELQQWLSVASYHVRLAVGIAALAPKLRLLLKRQGREPRRLITDKLRSYSAAHRTVMPSVVHSTRHYENNRAEVSHQPTRQRERQMRRFKSAAHLQRFASVHGVVQNLFRVGRHLLRAAHHRVLRTCSFRVWDAVTCAC